MSTKIPSRIKPEEEELDKKRQELAGLESELAEAELRVAGLRAALAGFERRYLRIVGTRYAELDEIEAKIAELFARNHPTDQQAQNAAKHARTYADDSRTSALQQASGQPEEFCPVARFEGLVP